MLVTPKLGRGTPISLQTAWDDETHLLGVLDGYEAILIAKYGLDEATNRANLLHQNWGHFTDAQRAAILSDVNQADTQLDLNTYYVNVS
jgi:hypothetical protein